MPTVSAVLIVKNEKFLKDCVDSFRNFVDEIVIVDTGSTDTMRSVAIECSDVFRVYTECNNEKGQIMDFSDARNYAADLATCEYIFWVDGDDIVIGAENIRNETSLASDGSLVSFDYLCSFSSNGEPNLVNRITRMHKNSTEYRWNGRVHEYLTSTFPKSTRHSSKVSYSHMQDRSGKLSDPDRNLRILESEYAKNPSDPRNLFYLARDSSYDGNPGRSATLYHIHQGISGHLLESYQSKIHEGILLLDSGFVHQAIKCFLGAVTDFPLCYLAYFYLGKCYYILSDSYRLDLWSKAVSYFRLCLSSNEHPLFHDPSIRAYHVHTYLNYSLFRIGDIPGAIESAKLGLAYTPDDPTLKMNLSHYLACL